MVHEGRVREDAMHVAKIQTAWLERNGDIRVIKRRSEPRVIDVPVAPGTQTIRLQLG